MHFPIESAIVPVIYGRLVGNVLRIDGNAGSIPPAFQFAVLQTTVDIVSVAPVDENSEFTTREDISYALCYQGVSAMTPEQWDGWKDQDDHEYIVSCVAANEGLTLA